MCRREAAPLQHVPQLLLTLFVKSQATLAHGNPSANVCRSMGSPALLGMCVLPVIYIKTTLAILAKKIWLEPRK